MTANSPLSRWRRACSPGPGEDDLAEILEHRRDGQQVALVVVDQQHPRALDRSTDRLPPPAATRPGSDRAVHAPAGRLPRLGRRRGGRLARARDPHAQERKQQVDVDGFGDIVGGAGIEAFLPVALHRLGGDGDQRHVGQLRGWRICCVVS